MERIVAAHNTRLLLQKQRLITRQAIVYPVRFPVFTAIVPEDAQPVLVGLTPAIHVGPLTVCITTGIPVGRTSGF